jgi:hypothetical protein
MPSLYGSDIAALSRLGFSEKEGEATTGDKGERERCDRGGPSCVVKDLAKHHAASEPSAII